MDLRRLLCVGTARLDSLQLSLSLVLSYAAASREFEDCDYCSHNS